MIEVYKFVMGKDGPNCNLKLSFHSALASAYDTRGNIYKLIPIYCITASKKHYFSRVTPTVCGKKKYPLKLFAIFLATARNFYMKFHTFITHS